MDIITIMLIILGLVLFEIISSIDNAIINAEVLSTMPAIVEASAPVLLIGGGVFLIFLFFHWLFLESKHYGLRGEKYIERHGVWFFAVISIILSIIVWLSIKINPLMAFSAVLGSTVFFITHGFKENAAKMEAQMLEGKASMSDMSKIFYLEVIDMTFSIDGVLGAFAFTLFVPLILIGNGIGAIIVRQLTVKGINEIKKYKYLKNGAMYSIFLLGLIMIFDSFGFNIPSWASPIATFAIVGFFFYRSKKELK